MRVTRILDLIVIVLLAVVLLMPRPDVTVKAALRLPPERRERVAELQARLVAQPDGGGAGDRARQHLSRWPPPRLGAGDHRIGAAGARERLPPAPPARHRLRRSLRVGARVRGGVARAGAVRAHRSATRRRCAAKPIAGGCNLLKSTLESVAGIDMRTDPALAKERIMQRLHPTYVPKRIGKPAGKPGAKPAAGPAQKPADAAEPRRNPSVGGAFP